MMRIDILTLFPDAVDAMMSSSILGRAQKKGAIEIRCVQIRDFTDNRQQQVDDYPYGGGWGCVMMAQPLKACLDHVAAQAGDVRRRVIYMSPQGKPFTQADARRLAADYDHLVLVCGHYEGVDERFIERCCDEEISIGDYVLTGGEIPAMAVADSVSRLVPGVLSDPECYTGESHWDGLLEYPQYTRPEVWEGMQVPEILRSGDHAQVAAWRREQQLARTLAKRPDMFTAYEPQNAAEKAAVLRLTGREPLRYDCRRAREEDLPVLLSIAAQAGARLRDAGVDQWQNGYPNEGFFRSDISEGGCWLFLHDGEPAGCVSICRGPEAVYSGLFGTWLTGDETDYGVVHRIAVSDRYVGRGLGGEMLSFAEDMISGQGLVSLRIDTHDENAPMLGLLRKRGYTRCGLLWIEDIVGDKLRVAYEKKL